MKTKTPDANNPALIKAKERIERYVQTLRDMGTGARMPRSIFLSVWRGDEHLQNDDLRKIFPPLMFALMPLPVLVRMHMAVLDGTASLISGYSSKDNDTTIIYVDPEAHLIVTREYAHNTDGSLGGMTRIREECVDMDEDDGDGGGPNFPEVASPKIGDVKLSKNSRFGTN